MAWLFAALCAFVLIALVTMPAGAQVIPPDLSALDSQLSTGGQPAAPAPWYSDGAVIGIIISSIMSLVAVWSHKSKKTAQKVSESLVIAIEAATKIPAVAEKEKLIKAKLRQEFEDIGVQPLVHRLVKDLT